MKSFYCLFIFFSLVMTTVYAQPANDNPCNAAILSVNEGLYCPSPPSFTTVGATTNSSQPSCFTLTGDVWFRFTATAATTRVSRNNVSAVGGTVNSVGMAVYRSTDNTCANLSLVACNNPLTAPFTIDLSGLIVGNTYYIRVGAISYTGSPAFNFTLCVGTPAPVPANDECANAISLNDGQIHGLYTDKATQSLPPFDCGWGLSSNGAMDGWYKFTATVSGPVTITALQYLGMGYGQPYVNLEQFSSCGSTTPVACDDDEDFDGTVQLEMNAVAGNTYYFRMYGRDATGYMAIQATGSFPLPVGMNGLNAVLNSRGQAILTWNVPAKTECRGFDIERMTGTDNFSNAGTVPATAGGNDGGYTFADPLPVTGRTWYRIRQEGVDGSVTWSNVISVAPGNGLHNELSVYPNPSDDYLKVSVPAAENAEGMRVRLVNGLGQTISKVLSHGQLDIRDLRPGIYQAMIVAPGNEVFFFRFQKK